MDVIRALMGAGFERVIALDGASCGQETATVLLALWRYEAEADVPQGEAWIHPYYLASQRAYRAASAVANASGGTWMLRDDIRLKPIFARLPGFAQGRNTLSYAEGIGSRFHVQTLASEAALPGRMTLEEKAHPLMCGDCRRCMAACPTGAIDEKGFHRERCLRNWMLSGKPVPETMRAMGNRLIGCDECQRCCPHNPPPKGHEHAAYPLAWLLTSPKEAGNVLREAIGANLALPNRVLGQACLLAGCSGQAALLPVLEKLLLHPSPVVAAHAAWAAERLGGEKKKEEP